MFDLEKYKLFVLQQVIGKAIYFKVDVTEQLLEALFQFTLAPSVYLKDTIPQSDMSKKYKQVFDLSSKSNNTQLNYWFLHRFGYKHCPTCNQTKTLDSYSANNRAADKLHSYCKSCDNKDSRAYNIANQDKYKEYQKAYQLANPNKMNAIAAKRRARKLCATPAWLTTEQHKQILAFYIEAKRLEQETGVRYHVDHIVPLQGDAVCGLHVPWNLQVLTATENLKKYNKHEGDIPFQ
jgi:hypothetical protein